MPIKKLSNIFPSWYRKWLFNSLNIKDGEECDAKYLDPLFKLNKNWLRENYQQKEYSWDEKDVATSYALYYMSINIPKLWMTLNHSGNWRQQELPQVNSLVEFGCGPGTFLWSYLLYLYSEHPTQLAEIKKIRGVDTSQTNLDIALQLFNGLKSKKEFAHIEIELTCSNWQNELSNSDEELCIFGNSLIESDTELGEVEEKFKNILIIEPGTQKHFQRLKTLRDDMASRDWQIHFPCSGGLHCPMPSDNWCHFHVNRFMLPFVQKMSNAAKRRNHRHNFCAFLYSRRTNGLDNTNWRLLSKTRKVKRTAMRYICNGDRMFEAVLGRKERSPDNLDFIHLEAAEMARTTAKFKKGRLSVNDSFSHNNTQQNGIK